MAAKREFLTTNEVAQTLGLTPFTIRRYIRLRKLKAVKLEGSYRVRRAALKDFLQAREIETEEELVAMDEEENRNAAAKQVKPPTRNKREAKPRSQKIRASKSLERSRLAHRDKKSAVHTPSRNGKK